MNIEKQSSKSLIGGNSSSLGAHNSHEYLNMFAFRDVDEEGHKRLSHIYFIYNIYVCI